MHKKQKLYLLALMAIISAIYYYTTGSVCYFKAVTGLPCPGCGMSRAFDALLHLDFKSSFFFHPLLIIVLLFGAAYLWQLVTGRSRLNVLFKEPVMIGLLALIVVVYIARMVLFFPGTAPMDYNRHSLVGRIYTFFTE